MCCVSEVHAYDRRLRVSVPWRGCVASAPGLGKPVHIAVSVPWRGCVASACCTTSRMRQRGFRPLAGMCCVYATTATQAAQEVSVPWRGCVASQRCRQCFRRSMKVSVPWRGCVASPKFPLHCLGTIGFRPLAGMCCVEKAVRNLCCKSVSVPWRGCVASEAEDENNAVFVFPSPGGDVLRLEAILGRCTLSEVSVPWRGCVASSVPYWLISCIMVSVPWRGCVASANLHKIIF